MTKLNVRMMGFGAVFGTLAVAAAFSYVEAANVGTAIMLVIAAAINLALTADEAINA